MPGSNDDARRRMQGAALELFARDGFERVTAAQIAAYAGVTERTFFRHFPDKREVLFDGEGLVRATLVGAIASAPEGSGPIAILRHAFREFCPLLESRRAYAKPRQDLIEATPALQERELAKLDALAASLADALASRGVGKERAALAARVGMAAFVQASRNWMADPAIDLRTGLETMFTELGVLLAPSA